MNGLYIPLAVSVSAKVAGINAVTLAVSASQTTIPLILLSVVTGRVHELRYQVKAVVLPL